MARFAGSQARSLLLPSMLLAVTLFLLSADHLFVPVGGQKIKIGETIVVTVTEILKGRVTLGFDAPEIVRIKLLEDENKGRENGRKGK